MKVELIEKFEMSCGTVLMVKSNSTIKRGESINVNGKTYTVKDFLIPSGNYDETIINVLVE